MNYDNLIYFFGNLNDFPTESLTNNIFTYQNTIIKYSILGCNQQDYNMYILGNKHVLLDKDIATQSTKWWGEIRVEKKDYVLDPETNTYTKKIYISISEEESLNVLISMKIYAKLLIEDEIKEGTAGYNLSLLENFNNCNNIFDLNILFEDFLGIDMPYKQAAQLNKVTYSGDRIYNENRLRIKNLRV